MSYRETLQGRMPCSTDSDCSALLSAKWNSLQQGVNTKSGCVHFWNFMQHKRYTFTHLAYKTATRIFDSIFNCKKGWEEKSIREETHQQPHVKCLFLSRVPWFPTLCPAVRYTGGWFVFCHQQFSSPPAFLGGSVEEQEHFHLYVISQNATQDTASQIDATLLILAWNVSEYLFMLVEYVNSYSW